jgi:hypothetical protein
MAAEPEVEATGKAPAADADLEPRDAIAAILDAMNRFPLVAIGEIHTLQEFHDFITALLFHPDLPGRITDIVVEFGNAQFQDVADRFVVGGQPVANAELERVWRHTVGGGVQLDAPVYGQFFRNVRAVNWMQPPEKRIRVILGDPAFDHTKVRDNASYYYSAAGQRDRHFADAVEREVLSKGRKALLIAGTGHVLRGFRSDAGSANAATRLADQHPDKLFVVIPYLPSPPPEGSTTQPPRVQAILRWPRPSIALLAGTWLGATTQKGSRVMSPEGTLFAAQADAVLYLGHPELWTASRPDPAIYRCGEYAEELNRMKDITAQLHIRANLDGLKNAQSGALFFGK